MPTVDTRQLIINEANRQGVPASIALAVAQRETGGMHWTPDGKVRRGAAGEVGMFQLMPATASALGVDAYDVDQNIRGGITYLAQLYARYGKWDVAIAAYNWGPSRVDDLLSGKRKLPDVVLNYVKAVCATGQCTEPALLRAGVQKVPSAAPPAVATNAGPSAPPSNIIFGGAADRSEPSNSQQIASASLVPAAIVAAAGVALFYAFSD